MKYLWIAIAVLLIVLFSINVKESFNHRPKKCRLPEDGGCPVHSSNKDPPYPHPFHYVYQDENKNRVYECSKCHCKTINPKRYAKKCRLPEDGGCPVHSSNKDPPYPHPFHYVYQDENKNRVYECSKCHCKTINPKRYAISSDL